MFRRFACVGVVLASIATGNTGLAEAQSAQAADPPYNLLAGNYLLANGNAIGINLFPGGDGKLGLLYADYESGVVRRLFPISEDRYGIGPGFAVPSPVELNLRFVKDQRGVVAFLLVQRPDGPEQIARRVEIQAREVTFTSRDAKLSGTLLLPPTQGPHPAIVLLHGSGPLGRWSFGPYPRFFASLGLAVLVYDKRSTGASTGTYLPRDSYYPEVFLNDAIEAVRFLQARDDIDSRGMGRRMGSVCRGPDRGTAEGMVESLSLDTSTPARLAAENMRRALSDAGNGRVTVRIFEGANHPLMEARTGGNSEIP